MNYRKDFHEFQKNYITQNPRALRMRSYLPSLKGKTILDVGCGSGIDMAFFKKQGAKSIAGSDISKELLEIAKRSIPDADIRNDTFSYLSWKNETFDVVWSKYALNCAHDITAPLKEIFRVCKKDGMVLLQITHPLRTLSFLKSKNYFDQGTTIEYPTIDNKVLKEPHHTIAEWINGITEAGFNITRCEEIINRPIEDYAGEITPSALIFILKK